MAVARHSANAADAWRRRARTAAGVEAQRAALPSSKGSPVQAWLGALPTGSRYRVTRAQLTTTLQLSVLCANSTQRACACADVSAL